MFGKFTWSLNPTLRHLSTTVWYCTYSLTTFWWTFLGGTWDIRSMAHFVFVCFFKPVTANRTFLGKWGEKVYYPNLVQAKQKPGFFIFIFLKALRKIHRDTERSSSSKPENLLSFFAFNWYLGLYEIRKHFMHPITEYLLLHVDYTVTEILRTWGRPRRIASPYGLAQHQHVAQRKRKYNGRGTTPPAQLGG